MTEKPLAHVMRTPLPLGSRLLTLLFRGLLVLAAPSASLEAQDRAEGAHPSPPGTRLPVVSFTLDNGMRWVVLPRDTSPTVSFVVHVPVGSVDESLGMTGAAHMLEHLLFKGSTSVGTLDWEGERALLEAMDAVEAQWERTRDPAERQALAATLDDLAEQARTLVRPNHFDEILSRNGARGLNASTSWEATEYYVEIPANRAKLWFVLEADRMRNPVFREFHRERDVVEEERRGRLDSDPGGRLWEEHMGAAFRIHPYGIAPIGHMQDIRRLTRAGIQAFHETHYGPENTVIAVVGQIDPDSVRLWAKDYFEPLPARGLPPVRTVEEPAQQGERRIEVLGRAEPQLRIGWRVPGGRDDDLPALSMLANLLVGGRDTRLHRRLVREEGLASFVTAGLSPGGRDPGLFVIHTAPTGSHDPGDLEGVIDQVLQDFVVNPPTPLELERMGRQLEAAEVRRLLSNLGLAFQLAHATATYGDWRETFHDQARLRAVTAEDVVRVVERYFHPSTRTVATLRRAEPQP